MATGSADTLTIYEDKRKLWGLIVLALVLFALSLPIAFRWYDGVVPWSFKHITGLVGIVLFGGGVLVFANRLFRSGQGAIELSAEGIRDRRTSDRLIPWTAITAVSLRNVWGQSLLLLTLTPGFKRTLESSAGRKVLARMNAVAGFDGYSLAAGYLTVTPKRLLDLVQERLKA